MGVVHYLGTFLIFAAMALMIVVSVGTPIWNSVYFVKATFANGQLLKFGQWGLCYAGQCTGSKLGYRADQVLSGGTNISQSVVHGLTYALIVNPIAAGFAFLALLAALFPNTFMGVLASILAFWAFIVTCVALGLDLGLAITARRRLNNAGASASLGNAIWLTVAAAGCLLLASVTVCFTSSSRKRQARRDVEERGLTTGAPVKRRGWFGKKNHANTYDNNNVAYGEPTYGAPAGTGAPVMNEKRHFWSKKEPVPSTTTY